MLYLVATPIGNLEDITYRAVRILREVGVIAAEDTRHTRKLLNRYDIKTPLISYHDFSTPRRIEELIDRLQSGDVALVSDAGMPGLSDPGYRLVRAAIDAGIPISPLPGPAAAVAGLVASGLPTDRFLFLGFLPRQTGARKSALQTIKNLPFTLVIYEGPHRLVNMLDDVAAVLGGDRQLVIGRELTKIHEEIWRGSVEEGVAEAGTGRFRGEMTIIIEGAADAADRWDEATVRAALDDLIAGGTSRRDAAAQVAEQAGWRKKEVYRMAIESPKS